MCYKVLQSQIDGNLYVGYTSDLKQRMLEHNEGRVNSTHARRPLDLIYYEACHHEKDAVAREKYFKTGFGRRFLRNRLENFRSDSR
ncbi:MAG: GIY-YIG nuclease family protein [Candidatus Pacebacteria bacterium]|nr:GIY-YIG nuclease family protein [Candidatus Paceibacterota bacterium]